MYRGTPSPIFDIPEIPTLRRVKPLPKRRRTTGTTNLGHHEDTLSLTSPALVAQSAQALLQQSAAAALLHQQQQSLDVLGPNATAEELLTHADTLSARMALQSYYMPILGGVQSFLAGAAAIGNGGAGDANANNNNATNNNSNNVTAAAAAALAAVASAGGGAGRNGQLHFPGSPGPLSDFDSLEFGVHFAAAAAAAAAAGVAMGGLSGLGMSMGMNMNVAMGMGMGMNAGGMGMGMERIGMAIGGGGGRDDDGRGDPDYVDHLQQHGNTKKRKVPANAGGSPRGGHSGDGGRPGSPSSFFPDDEQHGGRLGGGFSTPSAELHRDRERNRDRDRDRDRDREDYDSSTPPLIYPPPPFPGQLSIVIQKRGKLTAATLAGLQHKEMLKSRKRQLAAVMGALSHGDTLALDQALSASYPLIGGLSGSAGGAGAGGAGEPPRVHKSKRKSSRLARVMRLTRVPRHPDAAPFPACDFGFVCPSATADRLIATKEEVAMLRHQFEVELERQATKAAKMAVAAAGGGKLMKAGGGKAKREKAERERERAHQKASERGQQRARITVGGNNSDPTAEFSDPASVGVDGSGGGGIGAGGGCGDGVSIGGGISGENGATGGGKAKSGKKKKRSALANASNPHHLRNYVPSRLPHTGGGGGGGGGGGDGPGGQGPNAGNGNTIWPLALRFLSAEIPPRKRKKTPAVPLIQLTHPSEEWICAFCEYDLFYGEDAVYRRAVRSRKKILKRRRRARERAAAAASGTGCTSTTKGPPPPPESEEFDEYEMDGDCTGLDEIGRTPTKTKWKGESNKEHG